MHRANESADDLTVISKDVRSHQQALSSLVSKAMDEFQPQKCISQWSPYDFFHSVLNGRLEYY